MPSVFTLAGAPAPAAKPKRARKRAAKKASGEASCRLGECKDVVNGRTKRVISLCCVGKGDGPGQSRSGWIFKKKRG